MSHLRQFAIRNELLYSGFVSPNVQIFFVQKISFATFGVSIDDFLTRYAGLGYSLQAGENPAPSYTDNIPVHTPVFLPSLVHLCQSLVWKHH